MTYRYRRNSSDVDRMSSMTWRSRRGAPSRRGRPRTRAHIRRWPAWSYAPSLSSSQRWLASVELTENVPGLW